MRSVLFQAICRTGIFMICAQAIVHFRPQESNEKYLKLLVSVMVLIQLFLPLGSLFAGIGSGDAAGQLDGFRKNLEQNMEDARRRAEETDAILEQMTLEEVRRRMEAEAARNSDDQEVRQDGGAEDSLTVQHTEGLAVELEEITVEIEPIEQILGD